MGEANTGSFKKGQVANPKGRPVGSYSPLRKQLIELRKLAANDVPEMYSKLKEAAITHKESWAYQIYFKELVSVPKEWLNEVNMASVPKEIKNIEDVNIVLAALASILLNVDNTSTDEVHSLIKTLNNIKFTEKFGKQGKDILDLLNCEQAEQVMQWVEERTNEVNQQLKH